MTKQRALKIAAVCMAATLAGTSTFAYHMPVKAEETTEDVEQTLTDAIINRSGDSEVGKDETVYVIANADGSTQQVIVSDWLKNGKAEEVLKDASDLSDIKNVKGSETYSGTGDSMEWQAKGSDIYYQGTTTKQLPVDVKVSYQLDGKAITPEELAGKSGKVTIHFDYTNNEKRTVQVDGKEAEVYVPFMMVSGMLLDNEKFTDVEVTNGKVISEGNHTIVMGVAMPGLADSLELPEQMDVDIPEYVEVTANVTDFSLDMTITAAMTDMLSDINDENDDKLNDLDDLDELNDSLDDLTDASRQLVDGTIDLNAGAEDLDDGAKKIGAGVGKLADGTDTLQKAFEGDEGAVTGAKNLAAGAKQVSDGAKTLDDSVKTVKDGAKSVSDGAKSVSDGASSLSTGASTLSTGAASLQQGVKDVKSGVDQVNGGLGQLSPGAKKLANGASDLDAGVKELVSAISGLSDTLGQSYAKALKDMNDARDAYGESDPRYIAAKASYETLAQIVAQMDPGLDAKLKALQSGASEVKAGAATVSGTVDKLYEGSTKLVSGVNSLSAGADTLANGAKELSTGASTLATGADTLSTGASTLSAGTIQLKDGTKTLASGAKEVSTGANSLSTGVKQLYKGVKTVNTNMDTLNVGVKDLMGGTGKLLLGTVDLKDGMAKFDEEGIKKLTNKLTNVLDEYDITALKDRVQETVDAGKEYTIFTDAADGTTTSVKFIYKTEAIEK